MTSSTVWGWVGWQIVAYTEADSFVCVCVCGLDQNMIYRVFVIFCSLLFEIFINLVNLVATVLETIQVHLSRSNPGQLIR